MSHNTLIGLPPSGLMVYTPLDMNPSLRSEEQLLGSEKIVSQVLKLKIMKYYR